MQTATAGRLNDHPTEVNISPLIDMVFILLIFFIVTTVFVEEEGLPVAVPLDSVSDGPVVALQIAASGDIFYEAEVVTPQVVASLVRHQMSVGSTAVIIQVAPGVAAQKVISVLDSAREGGARDVSLTSLP